MELEVKEEEVVEVAEGSEGPLPQAESRQPIEESPVSEWRSCPSAGMRIGMAATAAGLICAVAALIYVATRPVAIDSFAATVAGLAGLSLALFAGVAANGCRSLRYGLSPEAFTINWLGVREIIPLGRIEGIYGGHRLGKRSRVEGFSWPGHYVGSARAEGLGRLKFYGTTLDPEGAIIVATAGAGYAITPSDLEGFRERLIERLEAMPMEEVERAPETRTEAPRWMGLSIAKDGMAVACGMLALLVLLGSFGYVAARFPGLPELMPLHFNFVGEPDLIGPPRDAFRMPIIGLVILLANAAVAAAVHGWQRAAGRILMAATVFVQVVMLIAVLRVVH